MPGTVPRSLVNSTVHLMREWDWRLYLLIFLYMALPLFYRSYSIYLIGNAIPDTNALATVAQWQFVELMIEVVQETFVLAIFFFVGKGMQSKEGPGHAMRTSLTMTLMFSTLIAGALFAFSSNFINMIGTPAEMQATTATFLRIKTVSIPILLMSAASVLIIETTNRKRLILILAVLQVAYHFIFDSLFYGGYPFSFSLGVLGVAWSDLAAACTLLVTVIVMLRRPLFSGLKRWWSMFSFKDWKTYMNVGGWSGLDSLVRNVAYFFLIIRLLNLLGADVIGGYYLAMHIIWSFMLVPILALVETTRVLIANHSADILKVRRLWYSALVVAGAVFVVWAFLLPLWGPVASLLNGNEEIVRVSVQAMIMLIGPYILLSLNMVTDSVFFGTGKTKYVFIQSLVTNGTVYVGAFVAYLTGVWTPDFGSIMILFGAGIVVDSVLTTYYAHRVLFPREQATRFAVMQS